MGAKPRAKAHDLAEELERERMARASDGHEYTHDDEMEAGALEALRDRGYEPPMTPMMEKIQRGLANQRRRRGRRPTPLMSVAKKRKK